MVFGVLGFIKNLIKTKITHPADINNTTDKLIMAAHDKHLINVPVNCHSLTKHLNISDKQCTYCENICEKLTTDEIIPCKDGGRYSLERNNINMIPCCNACNQSKNGRTGDDLIEWIKSGPKSGPNKGKSKVPEKNRKKMIKWIKEKTEKGYLKTDDPIILDRIKKSHTRCNNMLNEHYQWAIIDIKQNEFERIDFDLFNVSSDEEE